MRTLLDLKNAIKEQGQQQLAKKILILGKPKSGKTLLAATIARSPHIKRVFYFDLENSIESVLNAPEDKSLTEDELNKIVYIKVPDSRERPIAAETILKCFTAMPSKPVSLCPIHGKVSCKETSCTSYHFPFSLSALTPEDAVIIDSGSQLADSILSLEMKMESYKDLRKYYGAFTIEASAIMSGIQSANCNLVLVTHLLDIESIPSDPKEVPKLLETVPLFGSRNYSKNKISKYFGWSILTEQRNGKYLAGSSPTFKTKVDIGNRAGAKIEDYPDFDLSWIFNDPKDWPEATSSTSFIKPKTKTKS